MKNVLVLYNGQSMFTPTVQDYIESFSRYSHHNIHYLHVSHDTRPEFTFNAYDVLLITYSCRLCYLENMSPLVRRAIRAFSGLKAAFVQDEYQETNKLRAGIRELGITSVFTCVPENKVAWVYPRETFEAVRFTQVLTGYVPERLRQLSRRLLPATEERPNWIGYRGRHLGHCWGDLAFYKVEIGKRFKRACETRGIPHDIAWTEEARIYQEQWYSFVSSCRSTLGTPSGCNVFDWDGQLEREYKDGISKHPDVTYEEYRPTIAHKEEEIDMGQVSPRMFEGAALGTVLVLLEGSYSNVLIPDRDYISVKKDFSNVDDIIDRINDVSYVRTIADAAYEDLILSGNWSYEVFIAKVDAEIDAAFNNHGEALTSPDKVNARLARSYDQGLLEEYSLKSPVQYPMSRWLDLSYLSRRGKEGETFLSQVQTVGSVVRENAHEKEALELMQPPASSLPLPEHCQVVGPVARENADEKEVQELVQSTASTVPLPERPTASAALLGAGRATEVRRFVRGLIHRARR
jgi:hypothetical protein